MKVTYNIQKLREYRNRIGELWRWNDWCEDDVEFIANMNCHINLAILTLTCAQACVREKYNQKRLHMRLRL